MSINLEVRDGKSPLAKIFICHGVPCSMENLGIETIEDPKANNGQVSKVRSPIARDLFLLFKSDSKWLQPTQVVKLGAANENGAMTDVVGVQLQQGQQWTSDLLNQAKGFFEQRITKQTGVMLPSMPRDFGVVSDGDVKQVLKATLPSEVYKDNNNPDKAVLIESIDRSGRVITYKMGEACGEGDCGILALQGTKNRINAAMNAHFGVPAKHI